MSSTNQSNSYSRVSVVLNRSTALRLRFDRPNSETIPTNCNSFKALKNRDLKKMIYQKIVIN